MANCKAEWHSKGNREEADPGEVCGDPDTDTVTDSKTNTTKTFKRKSYLDEVDGVDPEKKCK